VVIVIDPQIAGISGDMILSCLVDMGANKQKIISGLQSCVKYLPNSKILKIDFITKKKHGIQASQMVLEIKESVKERKGIEIKEAITKSTHHLSLSSNAKKFADSCIDTLISAESEIHGEPIESVHFHEASSIDTLVDIVGTAIALDDLAFFEEEITVMPVAVGGGSVSFSHGTVSNPASAILEIFKNKDILISGGKTNDELTTPTGASILVNLKNTSNKFYPAMKVDSIGYGAGSKDFEDFANVLKIVKGTSNSVLLDSVKVLETNVDDISGEVLGNLIERLTSSGAKDVSVYTGITKKGRPTYLIRVICDSQNLIDLRDLLFLETRTLGIRVLDNERYKLPRRLHEITVKLYNKEFSIKYKLSEFQGKSNFKIEFDNLKQVSENLNLSLNETEKLIRKEIEKIDKK